MSAKFDRPWEEICSFFAHGIGDDVDHMMIARNETRGWTVSLGLSGEHQGYWILPKEAAPALADVIRGAEGSFGDGDGGLGRFAVPLR